MSLIFMEFVGENYGESDIGFLFGATRVGIEPKF
jgi:hypothetical protein